MDRGSTSSLSLLQIRAAAAGLLVAFAFGAFIEGAAGFGAPVAVSGAMLAGLALLAAGAYAPHAQIAPTNPANVTVVEKNQFWLSAGMTAALCSRSLCQDV